MKEWALFASVIAGSAWADGMVGTSLNVPVDHKAQRLGPSALADAPTGEFMAIANHRLQSVLMYVDAIHAPGLVALKTSLADGGTHSVSIPIALGWNEWVPLEPFWGEFQIVPAPGVEVSLGHLEHHMGFEVQTGVGSPGPEVTLYRARPWGWEDQTTTAVFRREGPPDRFADGCPASELGGVAGYPYVRVQPIPIGAGQTQLLVHTAPQFDWGYWLASGTGAPIGGPIDVAGVWPDGGIGTSSPTFGNGFMTLGNPLALQVGDGGTTEQFGFRMTTDAGSAAAWYGFDLGAWGPTDPCHPAVRATFGGHRARAVEQPPGTDFAVRFIPIQVWYRYPDEDRDGFKDRDGGAWDIWPEYTGSLPADAGDDCNDQVAGVHPGAPELCNGFDENCDGLPDNLDPLIVSPLCEKQTGVCAGRHHAAVECASGVWGACGTASYGPQYSATEATCDGLDNDCNGQVDESLTGPLCLLQNGVCAGSRSPVCAAGTWASCAPATYGSAYEPAEATCDSLDNDCDGAIDEGLTGPMCPLQLGVCAATRALICSAGSWAACGAAEYGAAFELFESRCDGLDNDCDGLVDGADPDLQRDVACPLEHGVCAAAGARHVIACGVAGPCNYGLKYETTETQCDGLDNDCDGVTDEVCAPSSMTPKPGGCSTGAGPWLMALALLARVGTRRGLRVREEYFRSSGFSVGG